MVVHFSSRLFSDRENSRRRQIHQGTGKILFEGPEPGTCVLYFTDDLSLSSQEKATITGKGVINNRFSELMMTRLSLIKVPHHFLKRLNMREQLVKMATMLPVQLTIYNHVTDSLAQRFSLEKGSALSRPLFEFSIKKENVINVISREHIDALGIIHEHEYDEAIGIAQRINDFMCGQFITVGLKLASIRLEFGRIFPSEIIEHSELILADEISLDTCEIIDTETDTHIDCTCLDKGINEMAKAYQNIAERFGILHNNFLKISE